MLSIHNDIVKDLDIEYIKKEFNQFVASNSFDETHYIDHLDTIRNVFNSTEDRLIQQQRINVSAMPVGEYIRNLLTPVIEISLDTEIYLIRAYYPIGIHADAHEYTTGKTIIIPMTFSADIKTLIFKETGSNEDFSKIIEQFITNPAQFKRLNLLSKKLNLKNCWFGNPSITDFLDIDGIATWNNNIVMIFDRMQFHGSNNYKEYVDSKDYVLIHTKQ
jgi:hypothetical protein